MPDQAPAIRRSARIGVVAFLVALALTHHGAVAQTLAPAQVAVDDFTSVTLDGSAKATTASMEGFSVIYSAGTGWNVTVSATQFREVDGTGAYVGGGKTLPAGSLSMPAPTFTPSSDLVTVTTGPYAIDGATVKIVSAAPDSTGTFTFAHGGPMTLSVPASAYARAYRSDVVVAVASGP